ncbi:MAG: hypothetical protein ACRDZ4_04655 [Egibacteraceae bacterium]
MGRRITVFHANVRSSATDGPLEDGSVVHLPDGWTPIGGDFEHGGVGNSGMLWVVCEQVDPVSYESMNPNIPATGATRADPPPFRPGKRRRHGR